MPIIAYPLLPVFPVSQLKERQVAYAVKYTAEEGKTLHSIDCNDFTNA